jgi:hypothetical protein
MHFQLISEQLLFSCLNSVRLELHQLIAKSGHLMHIIAENQLDQTSSLALAPGSLSVSPIHELF